jgi:hypothetical protein
MLTNLFNQGLTKMKRRMNMRVISISLALFISSSLSYAQQVITTTVGTPVKYEIESKVVRADTIHCGISVTQPNGTTDLIVLQQPLFKTSLSYTPTAQGTFSIAWKGEFILGNKAENPIVGGIKQIFNNIGDLVTLSKFSEGSMACPGNGTITIVASPSLPQVTAAPTSVAQSASTAPTANNRFRSTAKIPTVMNPPIESSAFKAKYSNDATYRTMVDDFNINRSKQSLTALRLYSELGDANAQFLYGLAHLEDWTGLYDPKRACYWIRESAVQGLSQARLVLANKAIYNNDCFDVEPTIDEAKTWAQLASMSSERAVKENADKLLQDILRIQITKQR